MALGGLLNPARRKAGRGHGGGVVTCVAIAALVPTFMVAEVGAAGARPKLRHLEPGGSAGLHERVPVNFVFLGYERDQIQERQFVRELPRKSRPLVRVRLHYGIHDYVGITYRYDYDLSFTDDAYEGRFFRFLRSRGKDAPLTDLQQLYNDQESNRLTIDHNLEIPGPAVEKWLAHHPPADVDVGENTVFFINWFGRKDFRFHIYTKTGEPDPDTGNDRGRGERDPLTGRPDGGDSSKYIAWGGTPRDDEETPLGKLARVWFHDLSAGPEDASRNWDVDSRDPGRGRIPPTWEYHKDGFRSPELLSGDLARVARFVAINALFTPSPDYDPAITPPELPSSIDLDLNVYEANPEVDASQVLLDEKLVRAEVSDLVPLLRVSVDEQDPSLDQEWHRCYTLLNLYWRTGQGPCHPELDYPPSANLFVLNALKLAELRDDEPRADYELVAAAYSTPGFAPLGVGGYADENYRDGTQSFVHVFSHPILTQYGYGMTGLTLHEIGHHFGLSHPFEGYDYERQMDYRSSSPRYLFVGAGDGVNSVMNYGYVNWDFSQFNRDNVNRWMTAAYLEHANVVLSDLLGHDDVGEVRIQLRRADARAGRVRVLFGNHRYLAAARRARGVYADVVSAARAVGIKVVGSDAGVTLDGEPLPDTGRYEPVVDPIPLRSKSGIRALMEAGFRDR